MKSREDRALTIMATALVAMGSVSTSLYIPSMPAIAFELGSDTATVQRSFTVFMVGFAAAQLIFGPLSDRFGRRPVLAVGLLLYIAACLACALSTTIDMFLWARFIQGLGACAGPVIGRAIIRDSFDRADATRAFAFIGMALSLSPALGPMIGGFLEVFFGWESAFLFQLAYGALMLWLAYARMRETLPEKDPLATDPARLVRNYAGLLRNRHYVGNLAPGVAGLGGLFAYVATTPFLFIDKLGISPGLFGMLSIFSVSGFAFGSWLAGRLQGRVPDSLPIRLGLAAQGLGAVLMAALSIQLTLPNVIGPMVLFVFGFGLLMPASSAQALHPFPRIAGSASAMMGFLQIAGGAAGSFLLSVIYDGSAFALGLAMTGLAALGAAGYLTFARGDVPDSGEA